VEEFIGDLGEEGTVFICDVDEGLSGYVTENGAFVIGTVFLGDTTYNKAVKGYISFDIRELSRDAPVLDARISISGITIDGDPTFADQLIVKVDDFEEINGGDFAVGGDHLAAFSTVGLSTINISSDNLKTLLERKLGDNKDYFQIKLGLDSYTGNPGIADVFIINLDNAELMVTQ
jgi:hypothetical protein